MTPIHKTYLLKAGRSAVWDALVNPETIESWGAGPATMDDKAGTEFSLWDGDIHGRNVEVVAGKKLVQEWFGGDWPAPSTVTFTLADEDGGTRLELTQTGVPEEEESDVDRGWDDFYLGPMKEYLES